MSTPVMSQVITANDKAEILALIHGRQTSPHGKHAIHLLSRDLTINSRRRFGSLPGSGAHGGHENFGRCGILDAGDDVLVPQAGWLAHRARTDVGAVFHGRRVGRCTDRRQRTARGLGPSGYRSPGWVLAGARSSFRCQDKSSIPRNPSRNHLRVDTLRARACRNSGATRVSAPRGTAFRRCR